MENIELKTDNEGVPQLIVDENVVVGEGINQSSIYSSDQESSDEENVNS